MRTVPTAAAPVRGYGDSSDLGTAIARLPKFRLRPRNDRRNECNEMADAWAQMVWSSELQIPLCLFTVPINAFLLDVTSCS